MNPKRIIIGILALAIFGIYLTNVGKIDEVISIAQQVLPTQPVAAPEPVKAAPPLAIDLVDAGIVDGDTGLLRPNEVVVILDAIPAPAKTEVAPYQREAFGPRWADTDGNGCDQRNDTLARDLTTPALRDGSLCVVVAGTLHDPFTGDTIAFEKAQASEVHIDHMVPLSWAWANGASSWSPEQRLAFANDARNLTAVSGEANSQKSDKGPAEWRPSNVEYRCEYVTRFVRIVDSYGLTIGENDRLASRRMLADCA